jgi:thymidylate synthase
MFEAMNYSELYCGLRQELLKGGTRVKIEKKNVETLELSPCAFSLLNPRARLGYHKERGFNLTFALFEFLCDVTGTNSYQLTKDVNPKAAEFSDDNLTFYGAYGPRISSNLSRIIEVLTNDKQSRQAVITIYNTKDMFVDTKDIPCTLSIQFLIRHDKLNMIVNMRSNDFFWGLQYDLFRFTLLQEVIANELGIDVGKYTHVTGSMHVYEYHYKMLENIENMKHIEMPPYNLQLSDCFDILSKLYALTHEADVPISHDFEKILATKLYKNYDMFSEILPEWTSDFIK